MLEIKANLRRELIKQRKAMTHEERSAADESIFQQLLPFLDNAGSVFCYASMEIEVDTRRFINHCLKKGIPVALPVSGDTELSFYYIEDTGELKKGRYGIDEPSKKHPAFADEKTLCVVPALCADGNGFRLGYGKGYYDRFLRDFKGTSIIICYKDFKREVPTEPFDMRTTFTVFDK
ncbi:MAG: 5-formyltetrahydrofolate cyclo-ligase [Oscillospiraceae bacterium]|nr:5-formyltetrahydrofolate cyclo-ligase [Oscillospiraceae bacterium]